MWFFSFYSLVTSCFACHLYISCKSCTCLSLCKLGHLLSSCLGHWFCMLFKLGSCISKRVRLAVEKESILITISSLPDARLRDRFCYFPDNIFRMQPSHSSRLSRIDTIYRPFARTNYYYHSFVPSSIAAWNALDDRQVDTQSLSAFKLMIKL